MAAVAAPFAGFDDAPEARAIAALGKLGTVVVAPAGNDGPTGARYGSLSSPGSAADALTVGASDGRPALPQIALAVRRRRGRARRRQPRSPARSRPRRARRCP